MTDAELDMDMEATETPATYTLELRLSLPGSEADIAPARSRVQLEVNSLGARAIDIVAYGPGLHMLRADTSPVQDRIKRIRDIVFRGKIQFSACNNTKEAMEKTEGRAISILPDATMVASGVVHLMELQEQGWSYVRP